MARVVRMLDAVSEVFAWLAAISGGLIVVAVSVDVLGRTLQGSSVRGVVEFSETLMVAMVFLAAAHAERTDTHVRVRLLTNALNPRVADLLRTVGLVVALVAVIWFTVATGDRAFTSWERSEYRAGLLRFPLWPARILITVGFAMLALQYLAKLIRTAVRVIRPDSSAPASVDDELMGKAERSM